MAKWCNFILRNYIKLSVEIRTMAMSLHTWKIQSFSLLFNMGKGEWKYQDFSGVQGHNYHSDLTSHLKPLNKIQPNLTGSKISTSSTKFVFFGPTGKQDGHPPPPNSDWLRHFLLLLWKEYNETCKEVRSQCPLPSLCFFGPIGKTRWPPWPLIDRDVLGSRCTET